MEQRSAGKHVALLPPAPRDKQMGRNGREQDCYIKALEIGKTVNMLQHLELFASAAVTVFAYLLVTVCMYVCTGMLSPKLGGPGSLTIHVPLAHRPTCMISAPKTTVHLALV